MYDFHVKKAVLLVGAVALAVVQLFAAEDQQLSSEQIYFKYCVAKPDTDCFVPVEGAIDTVGRDVGELGGDYRFCLDVDIVDAGYDPLRVILVLDNSLSMCRNPGTGANACCVEGDSSGNCMNNDPGNMRVEAAQVFIDSLRVINPKSEIGVVVFFVQAKANGPLALSSDENIEQIDTWIDDAKCNSDWQDSSSGTPATNLGLGLQSALSLVDENYDELDPKMKRHIILLTDGAWDDVETHSPMTLLENYAADYPDREQPTIHGVFISDSATHVEHLYPPQGCAGDGLVDLSYLEYSAVSTGGLYFPGSTPQSVVENFLNLLSTVLVPVEQRLSSFSVTNTTTGEVRSHTSINSVPGAPEGEVRFLAGIDNLPLVFGPNVLSVQSVVQKADSDLSQLPETTLTTVTIYRTQEWTSTIDPKEWEIYCQKDTTSISIGVTPSWQLINNPFTVNSTITLKDKFIFDSVEVRIFTEFPENDPYTIGLFHLEGTLLNSVTGTNATGSVAYTDTDALFGEMALTPSSSFSMPVDLQAEFAFEAWIKPSQSTGQADIFHIGGNALGIASDRRLYFRTGEQTILMSVIALSPDKWSHIAVSRANGTIIIYVNGLNVSEIADLPGALTGDLTVQCPTGAFLDEVRVSTAHRIRADSEGEFYRFDIPVYGSATWTVGETTSGAEAMQILTPEMWSDGSISFQFTPPSPGTYVVNFQHKGTNKENQFSKNGNPVTAADPQAPAITVSVAPPETLINHNFTVSSSITLNDRTILDNIEVRVFTGFPDEGPNTVGVFHLEENLVDAVSGDNATDIEAGFTESDVQFGSYAMSSGAFSTSIGSMQGDFAMEAWIMPVGAVEKTDIFLFGNDNTFGITAEGTLFFATSEGIVLSSDIVLPQNVWSHIALSRNGGTVIIYVNGINVTDAGQFTTPFSGAMTVTCPSGVLIDEIRISNTHRTRDNSQDPFYRFEVPTVSNITWVLAGSPSTKPSLTLAPEAWNNGSIQFQFSSPVPGDLVINMQQKGILRETQFSVNANRVIAVSDRQGPFITLGVFTTGELGVEEDTLILTFSEPIHCDSLKKDNMPALFFQVFDSTGKMKDGVFTTAEYFEKGCADTFITGVTLITRAQIDGIIPEKDSIRLIGPVVDTAGNYPDTTRKARIKWGPGGTVRIEAIEPDRGRPMRIPEYFIKKGIFESRGTDIGKVIVIDTDGPLRPIGIIAEGPDAGKPNYGNTVVYDPVANVVALDLPIVRDPLKDRRYYVLWNGANRYNRKVASGAYLIKAVVRFENNPTVPVLLEPTKFHIKWSEDYR